MFTNRHAAAQSTLGVSIGATNLAAASGTQAVVHPAVLHTAGGGWLSGFVDRIGDPVPLVASDGSTHRPEALLNEALDALINALPHTAAMSDVAVTVPAHWSASTVDALRASLPHQPRLIPDAMAATSALRANPGLPSRGVLIVCDFGGSGTSITLVDAATNFTRIGETVRFGDFSGDLIDQAILGKAMAELGDAGQADPSGTAMVGSLTRLREACRMAKHRLSADTATGIAVNLPGQQTSIRLTRNELEHLIDEPVTDFLAALDDTLERNGVAASHVSAVATIGGGARIPLLTQRLSQHLRTQVVTTPHPQLTAAAGAALMAARSPADETATALTPTAPTSAAPLTVATAHVPPAPVPAAPAPAELAWSQADADATDVASPLEFSRPVVEFGEHDWDDMPPRRRGPLIAFGLSAAAAVTALALFGMTRFDGETAPASASSSIAVSTAPVTSTQSVVAPVAETATVVVTPAPRLVPVGQRPQRPPQTIIVAPAPTTTATPTTTTTTTTPTTTTPTTTTPTTTTPTTTTSTTTSTSTPVTTIKTIPIDPGPGNGA
jgi:actin-like ATPase involved in cell morphogenesis